MAIVRVLNPFLLLEWLQHHRNVGISHFYLMDNKSTVNCQELTKYYSDITWFVSDKDYIQIPSYNHMFPLISPKYDYVLIIDDDEFIQLDGKYNTISEVIESFDSPDVIVLNWLMVGGQTRVRNLNTFLMEQVYLTNNHVNEHTKWLIRRDKIGMCKSPHWVELSDETARCIDGTGETCVSMGFWMPKTPDLRIYLMHYYVMSRNDFLLKCERGKADYEDKNSKEYDMERGLRLNQELTIPNFSMKRWIYKFYQQGYRTPTDLWRRAVEGIPPTPLDSVGF